MRPLEECTERPAVTEFLVEDVESQVIFRNPNGHAVEKVKVDDCVFGPGDGKRCDYLVNVHFTDKSYLIELKGSDIYAAYEQLRQTQAILAAYLKRKRLWIISHSGIPHYTTSKEEIIEQARIDEKTHLIIKRSPYTHTL